MATTLLRPKQIKTRQKQRNRKLKIRKRIKMVSFLKLSTLSVMYFVQGAPYGFQSACLPIILRSQGSSYTTLGVLKLLFLPWVCKPLYAPLVDRTFTRKWWLQNVRQFSSFIMLHILR